MKGQGIVDLHCHTKASDNTYTVREVLSAAHTAGIRYLAVTDHDTTAGVAEALMWGERLGVDVIPCIEISAYDFARRRRAHILGYYVQPEHPALARLCRPILERRTQATRQSVEQLVAAGYRISWEQVGRIAAGGTAVYKQHIMAALMESGHCQELFGDLYRSLFARGGNGEAPGTAFVPMQYVDAADAIRAIREAGGVPVLAHPGQLGNYEAIGEWVQAGLEGIEVYHPDHDREEEQKARGYAEQYGLAMTGGSDFHGGYGRSALGSVDAGFLNLLALKARLWPGLV